MDMEALKGVLSDLATQNLSPDDVNLFDGDLVRELIPIVEKTLMPYFRASVRGLEKVPAGAALIIGNHNAGITFLEPFIFGAEWYRTRGMGEPLHFIAHDAMVSIPVLKNLLIKCGAIRANYDNAYRALDAGHKVVIFPGGNHEAFRKFTDRFKVDFGGHKGFARVALTKNVPIVPHVNVGGQETFFVLSTGTRLAKLLRTDKLLRSKTCAISLALPFGLSIGPGFHFPLPAKTEIEVCDPIYPDRATEGVEGLEAKINRLYDLTVASMQKTMDKIALTRRFPVIG